MTNKVLKEVYEVKCPKCNKKISAMNENQFNYYIKQHMDAHARKEEKKE